MAIWVVVVVALTEVRIADETRKSLIEATGEAAMVSYITRPIIQPGPGINFTFGLEADGPEDAERIAENLVVEVYQKHGLPIPLLRFTDTHEAGKDPDISY